jgi:hypothetical protein
MLWTNLWRHLSGAAKLEEIAEHAAACARHAVWERVRRQIEPMGPAEARGYVRARSAAVVHRVIGRVYENDPTLRRAARTRLVELTTESLIRIISDQVSFSQASVRVLSEPVTLRRAA